MNSYVDSSYPENVLRWRRRSLLPKTATGGSFCLASTPITPTIVAKIRARLGNAFAQTTSNGS